MGVSTKVEWKTQHTPNNSKKIRDEWLAKETGSKVLRCSAKLLARLLATAVLTAQGSSPDISQASTNGRLYKSKRVANTFLPPNKY
jgi:hypothetical protein